MRSATRREAQWAEGVAGRGSGWGSSTTCNWRELWRAALREEVQRVEDVFGGEVQKVL